MSPNVNRYGLSRWIPSPTKRKVRQACGNGCVICGKMPYEYDHFDPEFSNATDHNPAGIALLCLSHHGEKTSGRLGSDEVRRARASPHNTERDSRWDAHLGGVEGWTLVAGGNSVPGASGGDAPVGISINGEKLFELRRDLDGNWLLSGSFCDENGHEALRIVDNEAVVSRGVWDVTLEGSNLTIRRTARKIVLQLAIVGSTRTATLKRLNMNLANGFSIVADERSLVVTGPDGFNVSMSSNTVTVASGVTPPSQLIRMGPPTDADLTFAINDRALGTWNDWIARPLLRPGTRFEGCEFRGRAIDLDGNEFINCKFTNCELIYRGGMPPSLVGCSVDASCVVFKNSADYTLTFLTALYHGGFQAVVDKTIENIRARVGSQTTPDD